MLVIDSDSAKFSFKMGIESRTSTLQSQHFVNFATETQPLKSGQLKYNIDF